MDAEEFVLDTPEGRQQAAEALLGDTDALAAVVDKLAGPGRIARQRAAKLVALVARADASALKPHAEQISDALNRPEAQTRWEVLHALDLMGKAGQHFSDGMLADAEDSLYDEDNGFVREAAFRFFCGYGGVNQGNSLKVWPLIDEAIQCYHGNPEFNDMLLRLVEFANGDIAPEVAEGLAKRMEFDATNGGGTLKMRSQQILEACGK